MFVVMDRSGVEYGRGDTPAEALNAAVRKFSPDHRKKVMRAVWEEMRDRRGFRLVEPIPFPFPFRESAQIGESESR